MKPEWLAGEAKCRMGIAVWAEVHVQKLQRGHLACVGAGQSSMRKTRQAWRAGE